jgi:N-acetylmuramoyl-L-alanine amidase
VKEMKGDLFVSVHFKACANSNASGFEVFIPFNKVFSAWSTILAYAISSSIRERFFDFRGIKLGRFYVLVETGDLCPSILIEGGFMTNKKDFSHYVNLANRKELADAIVNGIQKYRANLERFRH